MALLQDKNITVEKKIISIDKLIKRFAQFK